MYIEFHGAAEQVTGSCYLIEAGASRILLDCGMVQGSQQDEKHNADDFAFNPATIDAVILSHSHIDHSGRIPFLVKSGFKGQIYSHRASRDLCSIMLQDAGYLNERESQWENRKRERKGLELIEPYFTVEDAQNAMQQFHPLEYGQTLQLSSSVSFKLSDAGHILGSSIIELWLSENGLQRKIVFSGDIGYPERPILHDPAIIKQADLVIMESTYGDRLHRTSEQTCQEMTEILCQANSERGNIIIPAFAVGRTQRMIYEFAKHYDDWDLARWQIFLDSPMAISATEVYTKHTELYDEEASELWQKNSVSPLLPNLQLCRTANQSMALNSIKSGAIIIAGSGMCTGGRIKHHLKHNIWRKDCHLIITGFQARGTLGRKLVDGSKRIRLWGETFQVNARLHTLGGLSAHADQAGLLSWFQHFDNAPPLVLVHGEPVALNALKTAIEANTDSAVMIAKKFSKIDLTASIQLTMD
ncbi:MAG: MBL fold metallo-hydrolase [Gammaproteobacteria bacterium]|nr:MBL fold metallo-hydrolase [Gammaproteobacteria bacterium]